MSINIRLDKLWYIHTMEFLLHSDLKKDDWCMQQYRWVSQSKWWAKEAKHKRSYVGWLFIYNSRTNKINLWSEVRTVFKRHKTQRQWYPTPVLLLGKSHGQRSLVGCCPWGREESDTTERLPFHFSLSSIGEGNGNPLQCSCLENPRDGWAWWAAICGAAQSRTRLKRLSSSNLN